MQKINLMKVDRFAYVASGIGLMGWGLTRRNTVGGGAAGLGAWLLYQAYTGYNPMFAPLGIEVNRHPAESGTSETIVLDEAITIDAKREDIYAFWRDVGNLKRIAPRVEQIERIDDTHFRWKIAGPHDVPMEWESEISNERAGYEISWRTTRKGVLSHFGTVNFRDATGDRGTAVSVHLEYSSPAGSMGTAIARLFGQSPQRLVVDTLRNLKQLIEVGEIASTVGQPAGAQRATGADNVPRAGSPDANTSQAGAANTATPNVGASSAGTSNSGTSNTGLAGGLEDSQ